MGDVASYGGGDAAPELGWAHRVVAVGGARGRGRRRGKEIGLGCVGGQDTGGQDTGTHGDSFRNRDGIRERGEHARQRLRSGSNFPPLEHQTQ